MSLKPIISGQSLNTNNDFNTETVANRLAYETLQTKALSTKDKNRLKDPQGIIPNGIYKVFSLEKSFVTFFPVDTIFPPGIRIATGCSCCSILHSSIARCSSFVVGAK